MPSTVPSLIPSSPPILDPSRVPSSELSTSQYPSVSCDEDGDPLNVVFFNKYDNDGHNGFTVGDCKILQNIEKSDQNKANRICKRTAGGEGFAPARKICPRTCGLCDTEFPSSGPTT